MPIELSPHEARVIGSLIEKEITTPEQYPLSLNALVNACNQKSNRDPVLEMSETTVQQVVDQLIKRFLVSDQTGYGSRVTKYRHRFCNTAYGTLNFSPQELGIVCELLLRGPQTPSRLCPLSDVGVVEAALTQLAARADGPFVARLAREPGKRESRYAHLFSGEVAAAADDDAAVPSGGSSRSPAVDADRVAELEQRVAALEATVAVLTQRLDELTA